MLNNLLLGQTAEEKLYVEDVFQTYLYSGTGSSQTITTGVDLSANSGMVWIKGRSGATDHAIYDTARGVQKDLVTNSTAAQTTQSTGITAFSSTGFTIGALAKLNTSAATYASWTFRKSAKFFDCVTWTGNGANRTISHALGVVPGLIIVKRTDTTGDWQVYHRSLANTEYLVLNTTAAKATGTTRWNSTTPTATEFSLGTDATVNANGGSYVAYLFAHDTTADGIVQCGSFTTDGSGNATVNLGWEPQYIVTKKISSSGLWFFQDVMRGIFADITGQVFYQDKSQEDPMTLLAPTATGFSYGSVGATSSDLIYLAIRRGPMRVPTDATKVFKPVIWSGNNTDNRLLDSAFSPDAFISTTRSGVSYTQRFFINKLTGGNRLDITATDSEVSQNDYVFPSNPFGQTGIVLGSMSGSGYNQSGLSMTASIFRRAPGFFDCLCYSGTGAARTISHNLGVAPELMIVKRRDTTGDWQVYAGASGEYLVLNTTAAKVSSNTDRWNNTAPTSTVFSLGTNAVVNASGGTYVAYLFATCAGISKVGTYTGTGTTKQIDCGFTNGARFVLIKRTDSTGHWTIWDTARGIVSGNDPYLLLNLKDAEVTNTDYIDPLSTGFEISSTAPAAINANGGTFVFLAIA